MTERAAAPAAAMMVALEKVAIQKPERRLTSY